ncbi:MAG: ASCH domain-containing protein [Candidatus Eisenbacteria bacterium]
MRALTVWQPWAWAIVNGCKSIENRKWKPPHLGERIAIHAGLKVDEADAWDLIAEISGRRPPPPSEIDRGGIVGAATVVGLLTKSESPWFSGPYGWLLSIPRAVPLAPCRGARKLWRVPDEIVRAVQESIR